jgi:hypothetical protein
MPTATAKRIVKTSARSKYKRETPPPSIKQARAETYDRRHMHSAGLNAIQYQHHKPNL